MTDIDLFIPDSKETLTYLWYTNVTEYDNLGTTQNITITNVKLRPGFYNITVRVRDSGGDTATDSIHIEIKARPTDEPKDISFSIFSLVSHAMISPLKNVLKFFMCLNPIDPHPIIRAFCFLSASLFLSIRKDLFVSLIFLPTMLDVELEGLS